MTITHPATAAGLPALDQPCTACQTTGWAEHPEWRGWHDTTHVLAGITRAAACRFGSDSPEHAAAAMALEIHTNAVPTLPEVGPCPDCAGTGRAPTPVGTALLTFIRAHTTA